MTSKETSQTNILSLKTPAIFPLKNLEAKKVFDLISPYNDDPFLGHLSTPITTSRITKVYLGLLPAYKEGLSPLLKGINIGFAHAYFLFGPFAVLGPLRNVNASSFIGFISTISIIIILTSALLIYGRVTFLKPSLKKVSSTKTELLSQSGWRKLTSGFLLGGFGGCGVAYVLLNFIKQAY